MAVPNVTDFQGALGKWGLQSPNKFLVVIHLGGIPILSGLNLESLDKNSINLYCESASIAGRNLNSLVEIQYGRRREMVYNAPTYTPVTLSFYCSEGLKEKQLFDRWNEYIINSQKGYDVAYYIDYIADMTVKTLDRTGEISHEVIYRECYPKTISAVELNHNTTNATARLTVEMQYSYWETSGMKNLPDSEGKQRGTSRARFHGGT